MVSSSSRFLAGAAIACAGFLAACAQQFQVEKFDGRTEALFAASMDQLRQKKWANAVAGFEKLTIELPARDTLLPRSFYHLGQAQSRRGDHLLAAQSFTRVVEGFPDDTLADEAVLEAGDSYSKLWRKPTLDAAYGITALNTYRTMLALYPNSPLRDQAGRRVGEIEEMLAAKDYENGMHYFRRKAFDSSIIYFKDVLRQYPATRHGRLAALRMLEAYRVIRYREEAEELCGSLRQAYPTDVEVRAACPASLAAPSVPPAATPPAPVPAPPAR